MAIISTTGDTIQDLLLAIIVAQKAYIEVNSIREEYGYSGKGKYMWNHAFVGCRLKRANINRITALFIANVWEYFRRGLSYFEVLFKMKDDPSPLCGLDITATMVGYDHAKDSEFTYKKKFLWFERKCYYPCGKVCNKYIYLWDLMGYGTT